MTATAKQTSGEPRVDNWKDLAKALDQRNAALVTLPPTPRAALSSGVGASGAYAIPSGITDALELSLASTPMRRLAEVRRVPGLGEYRWPNMGAGEGEIWGEGQSVAKVDPTFGSLNLGLRKYGSKGTLVPSELVEDAGPRFQDVMLGLAGRVARIQNRSFTVGPGAQGVVSAATVRVTSASPTAITADELVSLMTSLDPTWFDSEERLPQFMMNSSTWTAILKLKDGQGAYLFGSGRRIGEYRVVLNSHMPSIATGNRPVLFGRFDEYKIRDDGDVRYNLSYQAVGAAETDSFLAVASLRSDGGLMVANADAPPVVALQMS